jgi:peptidoglycan/LPS O-acetylase OafA/YrhL
MDSAALSGYGNNSVSLFGSPISAREGVSMPVPQVTVLSPYAVWIALGVAFAVALPLGLLVKTQNGVTRLGYVDGLRGLLALGVVFHHYVHSYMFHVYGSWQPDQSRIYTVAGHAGVQMFFMVTGFLFWHKMLIEHGHVNWRKLYIARVFRIVPLYWFVVGAMLCVIAVDDAAALKVSIGHLAGEVSNWLFLYGEPDVNGFIETNRIVGKVTWTLKYEWLFYLALPLQALLLRFSFTRRWALWTAALVAAVLARLHLVLPGVGVHSDFILHFTAGAAVAIANQSDRWCSWARTPWAAAAVVVAAGALFSLFPTGYGAIQSLLMLAVFAPIALGNSLWGLLNLRPFKVLGEISYSIYLIHGIVLYVLFTWLFPTFLSINASHGMLVAGLVGTTALVVLVSTITYLLIEKPGMALGRAIAASARY